MSMLHFKDNFPLEASKIGTSTVICRGNHFVKGKMMRNQRGWVSVFQIQISENGSGSLSCNRLRASNFFVPTLTAEILSADHFIQFYTILIYFN